MRRGSLPAKRDIASTDSQYEMVTNSVSPSRSSRNSWTPSAFFSSGSMPCWYRYFSYSSAFALAVRPRQILAMVGFIFLTRQYGFESAARTAAIERRSLGRGLDEQHHRPPGHDHAAVLADPGAHRGAAEPGGLERIHGGEQVERIEPLAPDLGAPVVEPRAGALRHPGRSAALRGEPVEVRSRDFDSSSHVVRHQAERHVHRYDARGGARVEGEIEVAEHRPVAEQDAAAGALRWMEDVAGAPAHHRDQSRDARGQRRAAVEHRGNIGQRPEREDGQRGL